MAQQWYAERLYSSYLAVLADRGFFWGGGEVEKF